MRDVDELVGAREQAQAERARLEATIDSLLDPHVFFRAVATTSGAWSTCGSPTSNRAACRYLR